jgi:hypothetical protein
MDFIVWQPCCLLHSVMHYYIHGGPSALRFELAGNMSAGDALRLTNPGFPVQRLEEK